jgi:hypothetical protein
MAERKQQINFMGRMIDVSEVPMRESNERFSDYTLEDGSVLRIKTVVTSFLRCDGQWDADGNPFYVTKSVPIVTVVSAPAELRRKLQ